MTATAQNIKRMIKMLFRRGPEKGAVSVRVPFSRFLSEILVVTFERFLGNIREDTVFVMGVPC